MYSGDSVWPVFVRGNTRICVRFECLRFFWAIGIPPSVAEIIRLKVYQQVALSPALLNLFCCTSNVFSETWPFSLLRWV